MREITARLFVRMLRMTQAVRVKDRPYHPDALNSEKKRVEIDSRLLDDQAPVKRYEAARLVHAYIKGELLEEDESNWEAAKELKDLFDCHTCVEPIAQVYVKGIMDAKTVLGASGNKELVFQRDAPVSREEAEEIVRRAIYPQYRMEPRVIQKADSRAKRIDQKEYQRLAQEAKESVLIDVRDWERYTENALKGATWIAMSNIVMNPESIRFLNKKSTIFLYCDYGYQSEISATYLSKEGYEKIYYFGLKNKEPEK